MSDKKPIAWVNGAPVYAGDLLILPATRPPRSPPARGPTTAQRKSDKDTYERPAHLERLILNPAQDRLRVGTYLPPPEQVQQRASIGLRSQFRTAANERTVQPLEPLPGGRYLRSLSPERLWAMREIVNWPILNPDRYLSTCDFFDFGIGDYGRVPLVDRAVDQLIGLGVNLLRPDPQKEAQLSNVARLLLFAARNREQQSALRFSLNGDPKVLREPRKLLTLAQAQLAEGGGVGTTFSRWALVERFGAAAGDLYDAWRQATPWRRGLQHVLERCQPPMEPTDPHIPPTRAEFEATIARDPRLADEMVDHAQIPEHLGAIDAAEEMIPKDAFKDVHLVAVQHVLATQVTMFSAMERKGLDPARAEIIGVPYSTSYVVQHAFRRRGYRIGTPDVLDPNEVGPKVEAAVVEALRRAIARSKQDGKPILVLDDGGKVSLAIHHHFAGDAHRFRVVEQTTRGITELRSLPRLLCRTIDVASAPLKGLESDKIGGEVAEMVEATLERISMLPLEGRRVTVNGFGPIGRGLARALRARGAEVTVYDIDDQARLAAAAMGFDTASTKVAAFPGRSLIIGASGHRTVTREDLDLLDHEAVIASASSRDVEVDLSASRDAGVQVVPLLSEGVGDDRFVTRVWRFPGKDLVILRNGFPLNFSGDLETGSYESIAPTRAMMMLGAYQALEPGPVALEALSLDRQRELQSRAGLPTVPGL